MAPTSSKPVRRVSKASGAPGQQGTGTTLVEVKRATISSTTMPLTPRLLPRSTRLTWMLRLKMLTQMMRVGALVREKMMASYLETRTRRTTRMKMRMRRRRLRDASWPRKSVISRRRWIRRSQRSVRCRIRSSRCVILVFDVSLCSNA